MANPDDEWALLDLDERVARRHGMPRRVPLPLKQAEAVGKDGLSGATVRKNVQQFLAQAPADWRTKYPEIAKALEAYIGKAPFMDRAEQASMKGDMAGALSALRMVVRLDPEDHGARLNLATSLAQGGDFAGAVKELEHIAATFAGDAEYHHLYGEALRAGGNRDGAIEQLVLSLEAKPDFKPAMDGLLALGVLSRIYEDPRDASSLTYVRTDSIADYLDGLWATQAPSAKTLLEAIAYHESEARHDVVIAAAKRVGNTSDATDAEKERAAIASATALRTLKRFEDARLEVNAFLAKHPDSVAALVELAAIERAEGNTTIADGLIEQALAKDPGDGLALVAKFWPTDRDDLAGFAPAIEKLHGYVEAHPRSIGALRSLGRLQTAARDAVGATQTFERAVALDAQDDDLRAELWAALGAEGRFADIAADAEKLGDMPKRSWRLRWTEAEALRALGKSAEARAAFTALNPHDSLLVDVRKRAKRAATEIS